MWFIIICALYSCECLICRYKLRKCIMVVIFNTIQWCAAHFRQWSLAVTAAAVIQVSDRLLSPLQLLQIWAELCGQSFHIPQRMFTLEHPQIDPHYASAHFIKPPHQTPYHSHCSLAWSSKLRFSMADTVQLCTAGGYSTTSFVSYRHAQCRCTQADSNIYCID